MSRFLKIITASVMLIVLLTSNMYALDKNLHNSEEKFIVKDFILDHVGDAYIWHITKIGEHDIAVSLPVIVKGESSGWHFFSASKFHEGESYEGFKIAEEGEFKGKIVEISSSGAEVRPLDLSITKNVFTLLLSASILIFMIMYTVSVYKRQGFNVKNRFVLFIEMVVMMINDDVIKPCIGKEYKKFAPYLLTLFFFILLNNMMGIIPIFPFGANLTGNIAFTMTLALITFLITTFSGTKEYWKEIFWPDVPLLMKFPLPFFPIIEIIGVFTKPFALMIRLLANMLAGHSIILGLITVIFVTVNLGQAANTSLTFVSLLLSIFISFVELLVAFIQAYIFTLLSSIYIGLAKIEPHHKH